MIHQVRFGSVIEQIVHNTARTAVFLVALLIPLSGEADSDEFLHVYAAASLGDVLHEVGGKFEDDRAIKLLFSFASSSTLARQIEEGAPADVYISANPTWMDYLHERRLIVERTRMDLLGNDLVVVAPVDEVRGDGVHDRMGMLAHLDGRLALADPDHVPAGMYAKQSLVWFGWWEALRSRLALGSDVRAALAYVERGACPLGIVYGTDARASRHVQIVGVLPGESHDPIVYPAAALKGKFKLAVAFLDYLRSKAAMDVFETHGFTTFGGR